MFPKDWKIVNQSTSFPVKLPIYGNYGGPRYGDEQFKARPIDILDNEFMLHDMLYMYVPEKLAD